ncbi:MFS transporter [Arthrobacter sp. NPDC089319]|uniref:MFS transporter n=1 Tax=Arthrobacter sp. NPDC089319 TaxID=3155915 RepID=UPI00344611EA
MSGAGEFSLRQIALPAFGPSVLYGVGMGAISPVIALRAHDLGASFAVAALVTTVVGFASLLTNLPASSLTARFGERTALVAAAVWAMAAMVLGATATSLPVFAAAIFMVGMAGSVFNLARQSYLTAAVPHHLRARAMSTLGGTHRIGIFAGPFLAAAAIALGGIPAAFWLGAVTMVLAAALSLTVPDFEPATTEPDAPPVTIRSIFTSHWRTFATIGIGVMLVGAVRASRQAVLPLWAENLGLDALAASLIYGMSGAVEMLLFYPAGKLMDVKGRIWTAVPCMAIMAAGLIWIPFTTGFTALLLAALLMGVGNGMGSGIVMTLGADHAPASGRPQFLGLWRLVTDSGVMGGPALLSAVTALVSLSVGIWTTAGLAILGAVALGYWIPRTRPTDAPGGISRASARGGASPAA